MSNTNNERLDRMLRRIEAHYPIIDIECTLKQETAIPRWYVRIGKVEYPNHGPAGVVHHIYGVDDTLEGAISNAEHKVTAYLRQVNKERINEINNELIGLTEHAERLRNERNRLQAAA